MDISNVRIVVQWRATCTLSTLWQRFGRGARNRSLEAVAIFLVEKEHFDAAKEKKAERTAQKLRKKWKCTSGKTPSPAKKTLRLTNVSSDPNAPKETVHDIDLDFHTSDAEAEDEIDNELHTKYVDRMREKVVRKGKKREIEPEMDDLINAKSRSLNCRRRPINIYFENKKACELELFHLFLR
jgi:superfamily II DNA/RNA helicase